MEVAGDSHTPLFVFKTKRLGRTASCPPVWAGASPNPEGPRCLENDGAGTCPFPDSTCTMNRTGADGRMLWTKWSGTARQFEDSTSHGAIRLRYTTRWWRHGEVSPVERGHSWAVPVSALRPQRVRLNPGGSCVSDQDDPTRPCIGCYQCRSRMRAMLRQPRPAQCIPAPCRPCRLRFLQS